MNYMCSSKLITKYVIYISTLYLYVRVIMRRGVDFVEE